MKKLSTVSKTRLGVAAAALLLLVGIAGVAYAYFTTTASGSGSATVGSNTTLTITQTGSITNLVPGGPSLPVTYTISNPSANGNQSLGAVSATITSVTPTTGNTCATSNFTTSAAATAVGEITAGSTYTPTSSTEPTVQMVETNTNQDGCEGATVNLTLAAAMGS